MTNMQLLYGKLSTQLVLFITVSDYHLWLIQTNLFYKFKINTEFWRLSIKKKVKYLNDFNINDMLKWYYFGFIKY